MSNRLALIVDDSRSARHILTRMLESFGLEVAAVESAELALTYLQGARPDVIFMDHLMPGMDGFAAVRVLKANPETVTIPVLMYTSQEGEMYLSQARALGAMGVLPKTLKHADVAAALQQLNLLTADKAIAPTSNVVHRPAAAPPVQEVRIAAPPVHATVPDSAQEVAAQQIPAQAMPQLAHRIAAELREELLQLTTQTTRRLSFWRALAAVSGALCVLLLGVMLFLQYQTRQQLDQLQTAQQQLQVLLSQPDTAVVTDVAALPGAGLSVDADLPPSTESLPVAYGEVPLAGARLEHLRTLLNTVRGEQRKAVIRVETFMADFCLSGGTAGAYEPAVDEALQSSCELIGNPFGDALSVPQRQSVAFANLLSSINSEANGNIKVQLVDGGHQIEQSYPERTASLTAGEWNRVAERNQRVEFSVQSAQ